MRKTLAIEISRDLPLRARQLSPDELEAVFGGCQSRDEVCGGLSSRGGCCPPFLCRDVGKTHGRCKK